MIAQNQTKVKLITAFTHGHRLLKHMDSYKIGFDGTETAITSCNYCGAGHSDHGDMHMGGMGGMPMPMSDNAFKILPTPIELNAGEGLKLKCKYECEHGHTDNIVCGFRADEEMCLVFYYYAYANNMPNPEAFLLYTDMCGYVQNEGYPNENNPLGFYSNYLCKPTCYVDVLNGQCSTDGEYIGATA
jgi:hypothetical protein